MSLWRCGIISASRARALGSRLTYYKNFVNEFNESNLGKTPMETSMETLTEATFTQLIQSIHQSYVFTLLIRRIEQARRLAGGINIDFFSSFSCKGNLNTQHVRGIGLIQYAQRYTRMYSWIRCSEKKYIYKSIASGFQNFILPVSLYF